MSYYFECNVCKCLLAPLVRNEDFVYTWSKSRFLCQTCKSFMCNDCTKFNESETCLHCCMKYTYITSSLYCSDCFGKEELGSCHCCGSCLCGECKLKTLVCKACCYRLSKSGMPMTLGKITQGISHNGLLPNLSYITDADMTLNFPNKE